MKHVKWLIVGVVSVFISAPNAKSQTYFKVDVSSGSVFLDQALMWGSYAINKSQNDFVVDNYLLMSAFRMSSHNENDKIYIKSNLEDNLYGWQINFPAILNGLGTGIKWGYRKQYFNFVKSWAIYGSIHTTYNYFTLDISEGGIPFKSYGNSTINISPGVGTNVDLGKPISSISVRLDINLKYNIPVFYKGKFGEDARCMKSGVSPRVTLIVGGPFFSKLGANVGVFYEWMTYNYFKPDIYFVEPYEAKQILFGMNVTMFPWK